MTPLDRLVTAVRQSRKYGTVCERFIRHVGTEELQKRGSLKAAVKATKSKLHQVGGAYMGGTVDYGAWLRRLQDTADLRPPCREMMQLHASTRERLPILESFYAKTLAALAPVKSVLDVACGLNPLAIPWMPLAPEAVYYAYDIYEDMMAFIDGFLPLAGVKGCAQATDVIAQAPRERAQVALLLKSLPCLEQVDKAASARLLDALNADHMLVSYPVRSLGGRSKGMRAHYETHLRELAAGKDWSVQRFAFETELAFLIDKG